MEDEEFFIDALDKAAGDLDGYEPDDPKVWETQDWDLVRDMERGK